MLSLFISLAILVFMIYNVIVLAIFGVPKSLSMTYYLYKDNYKCGWVFPIMMYVMVALLMPNWITLSSGSTFQFLSFLAPTGILFVGTAPAFKSSSLENSVHQVSAYLAAAFSLLWIGLVTPFWYIIPIVLVLIALLAIVTRTIKSSYIYWLEMVAFLATFISILLFI